MDTHILIRWASGSKKLSRTHFRAIESAIQRSEPLALSAMTLLEIALLEYTERAILKGSLEGFFRDLASDPNIRLLPITYEVALEVPALLALRDPGDRVIVATARAHRLRLVTSEQRIIDSKLVTVLE